MVAILITRIAVFWDAIYLSDSASRMHDFAIAIINGGADVNIHYECDTPLSLARDNGLDDLVDLLIQYGATADYLDNY